jgi:hypothetical protein
MKANPEHIDNSVTGHEIVGKVTAGLKKAQRWICTDTEIEYLNYWNSIKKVVCVTKTYKGCTYEGGVIIGKLYDVVEYVDNVHPNGRFRIKGEFKEQKLVSDFYPKELFITLEQCRNEKIDNIIQIL